ncbi:MAG: protoglobin family protein, partial [Candidatus Rokuibacteriota bacterium]
MLARMDDTRPAPAQASYIPGTDMPRFIREMMEFVGLGEADVTAIRSSAPFVLKHADELTAALYDHFLAFPRSAGFFLREDGSVDTVRIERRKHSLTRWLRETAQVATTSEFSYYLLAVAVSHSNRPERPGGNIPPHLMVGAMSLAQTALAGVFDADLPRDESRAASVAWNKLLLVHLSVLLL